MQKLLPSSILRQPRREASQKRSLLEIFVDGAARGNPGPAGAGIYVIKDNQVIIKDGFFLEIKTNNQAEYLALALAVFLIKNKILDFENKDFNITITSDSELMVKQLNGEYKIKNLIIQEIKNLIDFLFGGKIYKIKHVLRAENKIADKLANLGIDKQNKVPESFIKLLKKHNIINYG